METVDDDGDDPLVGAYVQSPTEDIDCDTNYYPSQSQPQTKKAPRRPSSAAAAFPPLPPQPQPPVSDPDLANAIMVAANTGVEFHVRFASGATIAISPSSAPAASPSSKPLTRWSQSVGTQWHEKKRVRAACHNAAKAAGEFDFSSQRRVHIEMCAICHVHQPNSRCTNFCCLWCCRTYFTTCAVRDHAGW